MVDVTLNENGRTADFTLAGGCLLCAGDLKVRVSEAGAYTYCVHCHWISKPAVAFRDGALTVAYSSTGLA